MAKPYVTMIAAIDLNNGIGCDGGLIFKSKVDMKHFVQKTTGKPVVMGRTTFESIGKPLPNRRNIVLTRDFTWHHEGVETYDSIEAVLALGIDLMIIGGGEVYRAFLPHADKLIITHVETLLNADTRFPDIDDWKVLNCILPRDCDTDYFFMFHELVRPDNNGLEWGKYKELTDDSYFVAEEINLGKGL